MQLVIRSEEEITAEQRRQIAALLTTSFDLYAKKPELAARGWHSTAPETRVLALGDHGEIVGNQSMFAVNSQTIGLGDLAVHQSVRGRGVGKSLIREASRAAIANGARFVLTSTEHPWLATSFTDLGFVPAQQNDFVREGHGKTRWNPQWIYLSARPNDRPNGLPIVPGEF